VPGVSISRNAAVTGSGSPDPAASRAALSARTTSIPSSATKLGSRSVFAHEPRCKLLPERAELARAGVGEEWDAGAELAQVAPPVGQRRSTGRVAERETSSEEASPSELGGQRGERLGVADERHDQRPTVRPGQRRLDRVGQHTGRHARPGEARDLDAATREPGGEHVGAG
jgi:hypothetical protein